MAPGLTCGMSGTTLEGKEKEKAGEGGDHEAAHDHERETAFAAKPSPSTTVFEVFGPSADSAMGTLGLLTHRATSSPTTHSPMAQGSGLSGPPGPIHTLDIPMNVPPPAHPAKRPVAYGSGYTGLLVPTYYGPSGVSCSMLAPLPPTMIPGYSVHDYGGGGGVHGVPYTSLADLRGPRSSRGRSRGSEKSSQKTLTRSGGFEPKIH